MNTPVDVGFAALALGERDWPLFPCDPRPDKPYAKRPLVIADKDAEGHSIEGTGWPMKASADAATIRAWWKRWPKALIGVSPGRIGRFVVDLDPKGESVEDVLSRLELAIGVEIPPGPRTRTQSGGLHLWFARPLGEEWGNHKPGLKNIDIRCDNGYVIVPPSTMLNGKAYAWEGEDLALPAVPQKLLELIEAKRQGGGDERPSAEVVQLPARTVNLASAGDKARRSFARAGLDGEREKLASAPEGQRGKTLFAAAAAAGRLAAAGAITEREIYAALEEAADLCGLTKVDGIVRVRRDIKRGIEEGRRTASDVVSRLQDVAREAERRALARGAKPPAPAGSDDYGFPSEEATGGVPPGGGAEPDPAATASAPKTPEPPDRSGRGSGGKPPPAPPEFDPEDLKFCAGLEQNDADNGQRLIRHFGDRFVNVRDVGVHVWAGTHWELEGGQEALERFAHKTAQAIALETVFIEPNKRDVEAIEAAKPFKGRSRLEMSDEEKLILEAGIKAEARLYKKRGDRRKFAISCGNRARTVAMIAQALPHRTITQDKLDADPMAINCLNGVLRYTSIEDPECPDPDIVRRIWSLSFTPGHKPEDMMSKVMGVAYDPLASCARFLKFMARFQPEEPNRLYIQKSQGYACTGLTAVQALNFHYGGGGNGKSVFITTIAGTMGSYAALIPFGSLVSEQQRRSDQANPDIIRLPRVRLAHAAEPPKNIGWDEALVKQLTGGEPMLARGLFQGFIEFNPIFKLAVFGNEKPRVDGVDHGIWRRLRVVPWLVTIADNEARDLADVVAEMLLEGSGILNWLLEGLRLYLAEGLRPPEAVVEATKEYRNENDPVGPFLASHVTHVDPAENEAVTARDLYQAYLAWGEANGVKPISETRFGKLMPQKGLKRTDERVRRYLDIRLHDVPARETRPAAPHSKEVDPF